MKMSMLTAISLPYIATIALHGGCAMTAPEPEKATKVDMTPWSGTPRPEIAQVLSAHPGGVQINEDQIAWNDGSVVLTVPSDTQPQPSAATGGPSPLASVQGCPSGWFCFYQDINFNAGTNGRRLQFMDCSANGTVQFLSDYGFDRQTSSWVVNRSISFMNVFDDVGTFLWEEHANSRSSYVGNAANDRADEFDCVD